jgi:hypothetical protein
VDVVVARAAVAELGDRELVGIEPRTDTTDLDQCFMAASMSRITMPT